MSAPTIVITGTPGTGKSTTAQRIVADAPVPLTHINIGDLVRDNALHSGFDPAWAAYTVDDDKLIDALEPLVSAGGVVLDWHACDVFPERWPDLVVVLRCNHSILWHRLERRGYPLNKIQENNEAEIMQVVLDEARASYPPDIVIELVSDSTDDLDANVARIVSWIHDWLRAHSEHVDSAHSAHSTS